MNGRRSDAFVFFGATGDLAYKQIFPALQSMVQHGTLNIPVIGVAKAYVTRVGAGPFPSEIEGPDEARLRELGGEFGTVTGRKRRTPCRDRRGHLAGADLGPVALQREQPPEAGDGQVPRNGPRRLTEQRHEP